jgi:hypothetical protein
VVSPTYLVVACLQELFMLVAEYARLDEMQQYALVLAGRQLAAAETELLQVELADSKAAVALLETRFQDLQTRSSQREEEYIAIAQDYQVRVQYIVLC